MDIRLHLGSRGVYCGLHSQVAQRFLLVTYSVEAAMDDEGENEFVSEQVNEIVKLVGLLDAYI